MKHLLVTFALLSLLHIACNPFSDSSNKTDPNTYALEGANTQDTVSQGLATQDTINNDSSTANTLDTSDIYENIFSEFTIPLYSIDQDSFSPFSFAPETHEYFIYGISETTQLVALNIILADTNWKMSFLHSEGGKITDLSQVPVTQYQTEIVLDLTNRNGHSEHYSFFFIKNSDSYAVPKIKAINGTLTTNFVPPIGEFNMPIWNNHFDFIPDVSDTGAVVYVALSDSVRQVLPANGIFSFNFTGTDTILYCTVMKSEEIYTDYIFTLIRDSVQTNSIITNTVEIGNHPSDLFKVTSEGNELSIYAGGYIETIRWQLSSTDTMATTTIAYYDSILHTTETAPVVLHPVLNEDISLSLNPDFNTIDIIYTMRDQSQKVERYSVVKERSARLSRITLRNSANLSDTITAVDNYTLRYIPSSPLTLTVPFGLSEVSLELQKVDIWANVKVISSQGGSMTYADDLLPTLPLQPGVNEYTLMVTTKGDTAHYQLDIEYAEE